jgi:adenylate kinase
LVILLFGPPGCGKGTQTPRIRSLLGVPAIATGEMLRSEIRSGTRLGRQVEDVIRAGHFAGDTLMNRLVLRRLLQPDCRAGFLLDGYPRTVEQAGFLQRVVEKLGLPAPLVVHLCVPEQTLVERLSGRRQCAFCQASYNLYTAPPPSADHCACGARLFARDDDAPEIVRERLRVYQLRTNPVLAGYRDRLTIDGDRDPEEVFGEIREAIEGRLAPVRRKLAIA